MTDERKLEVFDDEEKCRIDKIKEMLLNQMQVVEEQTKRHVNLYIEASYALAELTEAYIKITSASSRSSQQYHHSH